jgi:hypothetical protein
MEDKERKELEQRAYGKPITLMPRHWTLYEWIKEQPGKSLRDKLYGIVKRAYQEDYKARGFAANDRYWRLSGQFDYDTPGPQAILSEMATALCDACECFGRAGMVDDEERAREMLRAVVHQQARRKAA